VATLASFDRKKGADRPGIAGVDEAGRGSLCGPVVAGAVLLDAGFYGEPTWLRKLAGANDSKKLSPEKRTELRARIAEMEAEGKLKTAWATGSVMEISAHNILGATRLAMARCIAKLAQGAIAPLFAAAGTEGELFGRSDARTFLVLVDGLPVRPPGPMNPSKAATVRASPSPWPQSSRRSNATACSSKCTRAFRNTVSPRIKDTARPNTSKPCANTALAPSIAIFSSVPSSPAMPLRLNAWTESLVLSKR
jgi:Ribonuclease HII